ncbi:PREDICTED: galectin-4-like [Nicrophorus vespilloides]|uniref:Galectin n=1 Tax=Nicrophorus vespilloides TaxID=110193 RepID=A0ABM1M8S1_NICVS|nr:PREDICTED: galectin-4-like [Nicrophorus vespilloides]
MHSFEFNVNLQAGPGAEVDIAVHVSVRISEGYVARNSFQNGEWGDEEDKGDLLIGAGQKFEIIILCGSTDYKIAMNGKHFCEFPQRVSPRSTSHLFIDGDVSLTLISFEGGDEMTSSSASSQQSVGAPSFQGQYGPPQGQYGPPQGQYGPPQGQYGPPQGQYGPPQGQYGPPQQGYGPPPPPGQHEEQSSGFDFLGTAGSVIAGAISSGMAEKLIGSLTSGGNQQQGSQQQQNPNNQQQQQYQQQPNQLQNQQNFSLPQLGGHGSIGGLGSVGSLLTGFAEQLLQPKKEGHH